MTTAQIRAAIQAVAPTVDAPAWAAALAIPMTGAGIISNRRVAMFIGQCAAETGGFVRLSEDLFYLTAMHIREVWPARFPIQSEAAPFIGRPEVLANHVYAERLGNGSEASGDGWTFRGRGLIQLTGRTAYSRFARAVGRPCDCAFADWLSTPDGAAQSAVWWWSQHPALLDLSDAWDVAGVTRIINGGLTGYPARLVATRDALTAIEGPRVIPVLTTADDLNQKQLDRIHTGA